MGANATDTMTASPAAPATPSATTDNWSTLFEGLPVGAFRSQPDGQFARVNTALARMMGYATEAELIADVGDLAYDWYVHPSRRAEILTVLDRDGSARGLVSEIYHQKTRRRMWISENAYVIRDAKGGVAFYEGTIEEVTERVNTQQALEQREALLRDVTASVPGMVFQLQVRADGGLYYEFVSDGVRALYGVDPEAVLADPRLLRSMAHPQDDDRLQAILREHLAGSQSASVEFRIHPRGGGEKWIRLTSSSTPTPQQGCVLHGVAIDISSARLAEQAALESERRWKIALEGLGDAVWDWDLSCETSETSGPLCDSYDQPAGQGSWTRRAIEDLIHPDDLPSMRATRKAHLDGLTSTYVHEHRLRLRDGRWLWVLSRGVVVRRDGSGRPLRMVGTHTDISERREAEALRQQRDRAAAADRAKSELMSRISHELRTPLNAILGFAQLMEMDANASNAQRHAWVRHILTSGRLLLGLVDDVLDLTQGQSVQFALAFSRVNLLQAIQDSWALLSAQAQLTQVTLRPLEVDAGLDVHADPKRLRQILTNLLSNAVKYNRAGGHITLAAQAQGAEVVIRVADTGLGVAGEHLERMFQPFERLGAAHGPIPGTGLGLALCKQLVEAMGGTITVASELGVGSCFTVRLPAAH